MPKEIHLRLSEDSRSNSPENHEAAGHNPGSPNLGNNRDSNELKDIRESLMHVAQGSHRAEFLPKVREFFRKCGIDPDHVDPVPGGEGYNHIVYDYNPPEEEAKVVKIPKVGNLLALNHDAKDEAEHHPLLAKYFADFMLPTEVRTDPDSGMYLLVQKAIKGKTVTNKTMNSSVY